MRPEIDQGLMIGWFANCAENAKDLQRYAAQPAGEQETGTREALAELVACKDLKDHLAILSDAEWVTQHGEYLRRKGPAWEAARKALANVEMAPQAGTRETVAYEHDFGHGTKLTYSNDVEGSLGTRELVYKTEADIGAPQADTRDAKEPG